MVKKATLKLDMSDGRAHPITGGGFSHIQFDNTGVYVVDYSQGRTMTPISSDQAWLYIEEFNLVGFSPMYSDGVSYYTFRGWQ